MPHDIHRIRLKGPWDVAGPFGIGPSERAADPDLPPLGVQALADRRDRHPLQAEWRRVTLPATWATLFESTAGVAYFRRTFHAPTNLQPRDRVLIEVPDGAGLLLAAQLNDSPLTIPVQVPLRLDVTAALLAFNTLLLRIAFDPVDQPDRPGGLWQPVTLAIESPQAD